MGEKGSVSPKKTGISANGGYKAKKVSDTVKNQIILIEKYEKPTLKYPNGRYFAVAGGELLESGFVDSFRYLYPDTTDAYSWWSYRFKAREKNVGWRIDYFVVSERIKDKINEAKIHTEIFGSDHCPVELQIDL